MKKIQGARSNDRDTSLLSLGINKTIKSVCCDKIDMDNDAIKDNDSQESRQRLADRLIANNGIQGIVLEEINGRYRLLVGERIYRTAVEQGLQSITAIVYSDFSQPRMHCASDGAPFTVQKHCAADTLKLYLECKNTVLLKKARGEYRGGVQKGIASLMGVSTRQVRNYAYAIKAVGVENIDTVTNIEEAVKLAFNKGV